MALACTPENFRAEMARQMLSRKEVAAYIRMAPNMFTDYVNGTRQLTAWAAHNIGHGINYLTTRRLFEVDDSLGVLPAKIGRPSSKPGKGLGLDPYVARRRTVRRFV